MRREVSNYFYEDEEDAPSETGTTIWTVILKGGMFNMCRKILIALVALISLSFGTCNAE